MMQSVVGDVVTPQGCGEALKAARERADLSVQEISQRLKMPVRVIQSLEAGQWDQSGGAVFIRGQLRSYGRLLKLDVEPFLSQSGAVVAPPAVLVGHSHTPRLQYVFESFKRRAVYVVLTLVIATPAAASSSSRTWPRATSARASCRTGWCWRRAPPRSSRSPPRPTTWPPARASSEPDVPAEIAVACTPWAPLQ